MNTILLGAFIGAIVGAVSSKQRKVVISGWLVAALAFGTVMGSAYEQGKNRGVMDETKATRAEDVKRGIELSRIEQLKKISQIEKSIEDHPKFSLAHSQAVLTKVWIEADDAEREEMATQLVAGIRAKPEKDQNELHSLWTKELIIQLFNEEPEHIQMLKIAMAANDHHLRLLKITPIASGKIPLVLGSSLAIKRMYEMLGVELAFSPNLPHMPE